jgi:hypothetical protein
MRYPATKFAGRFPRCFDSVEQYAGWRDAARQCHSTLTMIGPCHDCTPKFQSKMIGCGRCENPHVVFVVKPVRAKGEIIDHELVGHASRYVQVAA